MKKVGFLLTLGCLAVLLLGVSPAVAGAPSQYLYVLVSPTDPAGPSAIVLFDVDRRGGLNQRAVYETGGLGRTYSSEQGLVIDPARRLMFAANNEDATISAFHIAADGSLTAVSGSPFDAGSTPVFLAIQPTGNRLFAVHPGEIKSYEIRSNGSLVPEGSTGYFAYGDLRIDSAGRNLYVADMSEGVRAYAISPSGALSEQFGSPYRFSEGGRPYNIELVQDRRLMVLDLDEGFGVFEREKFGGLNAVPGMPFPVGQFAQTFTTTTDGRYAYVSIPFAPEMHGYRVDEQGTMTPLPASPFAGDYQAAALIVPPGLPRLYEVSLAMGHVNLWRIAEDGGLSKTGTYPIDDPRTPNGAAFLSGRWPGRMRTELPPLPGPGRLRLR